MISGTTVADKGEIFPAGTQLKMTRDRILLKPLDWQPSEIIHVVREGRPVRGKVISIGPGRWDRKYAPDKSSFKETQTFIKTQVKVGDVVELGGMNVFDGRGYSFPEVTIGTERYLICQEQDVVGIRTDV